MKNKVIIVGGVAGGASCAARLRRHDEESEIVLLERGANVSFANCGLPYFIGGVIKEEDSLYLASVTSFRQRFKVDARVNSEVTYIDRSNKKVTILDRINGSSYTESYDSLVLSPGSKPIRPNLPGIDLPGIFSVRDVPDSKKIKNWIEKHEAKRAVVIGAGFIGLEMAENLLHLGIETVIIERGNQVMASVDPEMTQLFEKSLEQHGATLLFGTEVKSFSSNAGQLSVNTSDGESLSADMVILAIGVRPESDLAEQCGLTLGERGHVIVDSNLRSSDPSIYAVGDCIEVHNVISGQSTALALAGPANRQGRIAADMLAGHSRHFRGVQGTSVCGVFEQTIASTGLTEKALRANNNTDYGVIYGHPNNHVGYYPGATQISMKLLYERATGRVLGAQAAGESDVERRIDVISMAIQMKASVFDLEESELCYAPQYGAAKDPVNLVGMVASNAMRGDISIGHWDNVGKEGFLLLDVRDANETVALPITGSINIPLNDLRSRHHELHQHIKSGAKDKTLLVTCATGPRANNAVRLLRNLGYAPHLLPGGEKTWAAFSVLRQRDAGESQAVSHSAVNASTENLSATTNTPSAAERIMQKLDKKTNNKGLQLVREKLESVTILQALPDEKIVEALPHLTRVPVKKGEQILSAGEKNDSFYIIYKGSAKKIQAAPLAQNAPTVSLLHAGEHFNAEASLMQGSCDSSVTMLTDGTLLRMPSAEFLRLIVNPLVKTVSAEALQNLSESQYQVIDVRHRVEIDEDPILGSIKIPLAVLPQSLDKLKKSENYLICCSTGKRSAVAAMILQEHGFHAASLQGGRASLERSTADSML